LSTGLGSFLSDSSFRRGLTFRHTVFLLIVYTLVYLFFANYFMELIMGWSKIAKALVSVIIIAPGGIIMGHLFPQGLALVNAENRALVPWAWAVNGAMGTIAAGIAPLFAQIVGFNWVIISGVCCYAVILFLPYYAASPNDFR